MSASFERAPRHHLLLVVLASCAEGEGGSGVPHGDQGTDGTTHTTVPPAPDSAGADSTGPPGDPTCIDDYHGNQDRPAALDLALDPTDTVSLVLGDGSASVPPETGSDELAVCASFPSDFFVLHTPCPGHVAIEARALGGEAPDLLLYDDSLPPAADPIAQALGTWHHFFLKPLHGELEAGTYVIEVRHSGDAAQRYSLAVLVLPTCAA